MKVTKKVLVDELAEYKELGVETKLQAEHIIDYLQDTIEEHLVKEDKISIFNFGTLEVKESKERKGHNPATGEPLTIPASKSVKFKQSKVLKAKLND